MSVGTENPDAPQGVIKSEITAERPDLEPAEQSEQQPTQSAGVIALRLVKQGWDISRIDSQHGADMVKSRITNPLNMIGRSVKGYILHILDPDQEIQIKRLFDRQGVATAYQKKYYGNDSDAPQIADDQLPPCTVSWVIFEGREKPIHPDWVRSVREECQRANVPFWFVGWGNWIPYEDAQPPMIESQHGDFMDSHGLPPNLDILNKTSEWMYEDYSPGEVVLFRKVGWEVSGHKLDGEVWQEVPQASEANSVAPQVSGSDISPSLVD